MNRSGGDDARPRQPGVDAAVALLGPRIRLVPLAPADRELYRRLHTCPQVMRAIEPPLTREAADARLERMARHNASRVPGHRTWVIRPSGGTQPVGLAALHRSVSGADIGFMLLPEAQRSGYATHALSLMLPHAFDCLRITRVEAGSRMDLDRLLMPFGFLRTASPCGSGFRWSVDRPAESCA